MPDIKLLKDLGFGAELFVPYGRSPLLGAHNMAYPIRATPSPKLPSATSFIFNPNHPPADKLR